MRHPVYRLASDDTGRARLQPAGRRSWRRTVVIPREACIFEQVPCAGVKWLERRNFARLQALRLAPYATTGASAAIRRGRLMLWLWDKDEVDAALLEAGLDPTLTRTIAEPLLLPVPARSGSAELHLPAGIDHLELDRGAILASRWEPSRQAGPNMLHGLRRNPWAADLLQPQWWSVSGKGGDLRHRAVFATCALAVLSAAHLAYWAGGWWHLEQQVETLDQAPDEQDSVIAAVARLKAQERGDLAWLEHYRRLSSSLQIRALLNALERPLEANRLVIKELEVREDDLRITLAAVGAEIDLPAVLLALERIPGIDAVQLRQNNDTAQATYTMRPVGFRASMMPTGAAR
jgi:hypothetical protein